jgi:tetratricopeptide (TPR) repeat protein
MEYACEQANRHALLAGQQPRFGMTAIALIYGPRPVSEALPIIEARVETDRQPGARLDLALFLAMSDRIDEALAHAKAAEDQLREFGGERLADARMADIERLAGNPRAEADRLRAYCDDVRVRGVTAALSTYASQLGRALCSLGEFDEVEELAVEGRENGAEDDPVTQALWRQVTGLAQAHRGNHADAERFAREAVEHAQRTDSPWTQGDALFDLAQVFEAAGRREESSSALHQALALYERKEIIPLARRTRERLAAPEQASGMSTTP